MDKAIAEGNHAKIRYYSYLLGKRSKAVKILAVNRVCKINDGKHTAGVDGMAISEDKKVAEEQMILLLNEINVIQKPKPIRRVYIPKPNGKLRPLGIPTLKDRINQEIIRTTIEPICEYHFLPCSYGFRPKRSCHDAISDIFTKLSRKVSSRWIVEGDIKGCFDNIKHSHITETLSSWRVSDWVIHVTSRMLSSGGKVGTPQGGIISPMLANVALTCLDEKVNSTHKRINPIVRYADDFIIVAKDKETAIALKESIQQHLKSEVGLELSEEKTSITEISKGFDFLGFNIRKYDEKLLIKPSKDNILGFRQGIRETAKVSQNLTGKSLIMKLNPKITGWGNYYRHVVSKETFNKQDDYLFKRTYKWVERKHLNNSKKGLVKRYYKTEEGGIWNLKDDTIKLAKMSDIPIKRFIKVRSDMRVYNMNDSEYWHKREFINAIHSIHNSYEYTRLFKIQKGRCEYCDQSITNKDIQSYNIHRHHLKPKSSNGVDQLSNLKLLHKECHRELHGKLSKKDMAKLLDKGIDYVRLLNPV
jgi:RNA-directed DNA polymerase